MKDDLQNAETRQRLLVAAAQVFAQEGYYHATVRAICELAEANVAAVNYHFGDKAGLYREVFRQWFKTALEKYPIDWNLPENPTVTDRLYTFVRSFLYRVLDESKLSCAGRLMGHEITKPTGLLDDFIKENVQPLFINLSKIVTELVASPVSEDCLRHFCFSIIGQCLFYRHAQPIIHVLSPKCKFDSKAIDRIAEHITQFSIAAIHQLSAKGSRS